MRTPSLAVLAGILMIPLATPASAVDLSSEAGVVSRYRDRGLALSEGATIQASITADHETGAYLNLWGSTLAAIGELDQSEVDVSIGYARELTGRVSIDAYATYILYPSISDADYVELTAATSMLIGPASASLGISLAPAQHGVRDDLGRKTANLYLFAAGEVPLPRTPIKIRATIGRERGPFDATANDGKWDWSLGSEIEFDPLRAGIAYVGSNADTGNRHGIVGSLFVTW